MHKTFYSSPMGLILPQLKDFAKFCSQAYMFSLHYSIIFVSLSDTHVIVICFWSKKSPIHLTEMLPASQLVSQLTLPAVVNV